MFKKKFNITQDADFIASEPALAADIDAFEHEDGPGPDLNHSAFDLRHSCASPWNSTIIELLLCEFQRICMDENWPIRKPDNYVWELLKNWYKKLRMTWFMGQPKLTWDGTLESPDEVKA